MLSLAAMHLPTRPPRPPRLRVRRPIARALTGALLLTLALVTGVPIQATPITTLAFSPDDAFLVSNGARAIQVRSGTNGAVLRSWNCPLPKITALRFDPQGRYLAVAGGTPAERGDVLLLSWPDGKEVTRWSHPSDLATSLDFSPDGSRLVVAGAHHLALVWSVPHPGSQPASLQAAVPAEIPALSLIGHAGPLLAVAWDPADGLITTASADRSIKVWSSDDGRLIRTFTHHTEPPNTLAFRPPSDRADPGAGGPSVCASGADDRTVRIWQPGLGRMVRIVRKHSGAILALAWAPDAASLFSAGTEGLLRRLDGASDQVLSEWRGHDDWVLALATSSEGSRLASGDASGQLKIWDARTELPTLLHAVR